ncbi:hypothetical protein HDU96_010678 [Phlyctochytrium bullatum]|nr:hypothetical protein HDU96_010678 [Phlyctochytrium bullatum]
MPEGWPADRVDESQDLSFAKYLAPKLNLLLHLLDKKRSSDTTNILLYGLEILPTQVRYVTFRGKTWRYHRTDMVARYVPRLLEPAGLDIGAVFERIFLRTQPWRDPASTAWTENGPGPHGWLLLRPSAPVQQFNAKTLAKHCTGILRAIGLPKELTCHTIHSSVAIAQEQVGWEADLINNGRCLWRPADYDRGVPYHRPMGWAVDSARPDSAAFRPLEPPVATASITVAASEDEGDDPVSDLDPALPAPALPA